MRDFKKIGDNCGHNNIVFFVERGDFDENKFLIKEEGDYCEGHEHLGLIVKAPCPLGAFGDDLMKNNFLFDYFTKRALSSNNQLISNRLKDLFELTFIETKFNYALVIGPPESTDIIYPLIVDACEIYDFTAFCANNKNHLHTIPIPLDFGSAFGDYHEFKNVLN